MNPETPTDQVVEVTQYMRPYGRPVKQYAKVSENLSKELAAIQDRGWRVAAEVLTTGEVSITVEDPIRERDVTIKVVPNGPEVPKALVEAIREAAREAAKEREL